MDEASPSRGCIASITTPPGCCQRFPGHVAAGVNQHRERSTRSTLRASPIAKRPAWAAIVTLTSSRHREAVAAFPVLFGDEDLRQARRAAASLRGEATRNGRSCTRAGQAGAAAQKSVADGDGAASPTPCGPLRPRLDASRYFETYFANCDLKGRRRPLLISRHVIGGRDQPATFADEQVAMLEIGGHRPPVLAVLCAGGRHAIDGLDALGMEEVARHAQALAQVDRPDEEQIDAVDGGNRVALLDRPSVSIWIARTCRDWPSGELGGRNAAEVGVEATVVETARARAA